MIRLRSPDPVLSVSSGALFESPPSTPPPPPDRKVFLRLFHKEEECPQKSIHSIGDAFPLLGSSVGELADEEFVRARAVSPAPRKPSREVRSDSTAHLHQKRHCQISREFRRVRLGHDALARAPLHRRRKTAPPAKAHAGKLQNSFSRWKFHR